MPVINAYQEPLLGTDVELLTRILGVGAQMLEPVIAGSVTTHGPR